MNPSSTISTINFRTNYNHKLDCPYFLHIDLAPAPGSVPESLVEKTTIVIATMDGSHPPVRTKLIDLARFPLKNLSENFVLLSHGVTKNDFLNLLKEKKVVNDETEMAVYYYKKLE